MIPPNIIDRISSIFPTFDAAVCLQSADTTLFDDPSLKIDIIIIDKNFHELCTSVLWDNETMISITSLPLNDLDNVICNELFDPDQYLYHTICEGEIIKDTSSLLFTKIKSKLLELPLWQKNIDDLNTLSTINKLIELRTEILTAVDNGTIFLMVNAIIQTISDLEYATSGKSHLFVKKAIFLSERRPDFINELIAVFRQQFIRPDTSRLSNLIDWIDKYLMKFHPKEAFDEPTTEISLNIGYSNITVEDFLIKLLPPLKSHLMPGISYEYFYLSPKNYNHVYPYSFTIVFHATPPQSLKLVYDSINKAVGNIGLKCGISFTPSLSGRFQARTALLQFMSPFFKEISEMNEKMFWRTKHFDAERGTLIGLIIYAGLIKQLNVNTKDILTINNMLYVRWFITPDEKSRIKSSKELAELMKKKNGIYQRYYENHKQFVNEAVSKGFSFAATDFDTLKDYYPALQALMSAIPKLSYIKSSSSHITLEIQEGLNLQEPDKARQYLIIFERLSDALLLNQTQKVLSLYLLSQAINNL